MAESVITVLYGRGTSLNLTLKKIIEVPECISILTNLSVLLLNNNSITTLPELTELNLGNNATRELPAVLGHLESLKRLYLFSSHITVMPPEVIGGLQNLIVLNLNHNQIQRLPPEIKSLRRLQQLSALDNKLEEIPVELGHLIRLSELNLTSNDLSGLPRQLYQCKELSNLYVARNKLTSLPEGIGALVKLQVLDVAGNKLSMFPVEFHLLPLMELYCEGYRFVRCEPMSSVQDAEELVARFVLRQDRNRHSLIHTIMLANGSCCTLLSGPLPHHLTRDMKMRSTQIIPLCALLCSYKCFNTDEHSYHGVATR